MSSLTVDAAGGIWACVWVVVSSLATSVAQLLLLAELWTMSEAQASIALAWPLLVWRDFDRVEALNVDVSRRSFSSEGQENRVGLDAIHFDQTMHVCDHLWGELISDLLVSHVVVVIEDDPFAGVLGLVDFHFDWDV